MNLFSELSCQVFVGPHHSPVSRLTRNVNVLNPVCEEGRGTECDIHTLFLDVATRECQQPYKHKQCLQKVLNRPLLLIRNVRKLLNEFSNMFLHQSAPS